MAKQKLIVMLNSGKNREGPETGNENSLKIFLIPAHRGRRRKLQRGDLDLALEVKLRLR